MSAKPPNKPKLTPQEQENLTAYLDHELDDAGAEQVTAALSRRPEVRKEAETLRKTWEMLDYLPRPVAPKSFTEQTLTRLSATKGILLQQGMKWRRYAIYGWVACLLTAGAFGFWLTYSFHREPEVVEVHAPETDVIPVLKSHQENHQHRLRRSWQKRMPTLSNVSRMPNVATSGWPGNPTASRRSQEEV